MKIENLNKVIEKPNHFFFNIDNKLEMKKYGQDLDFDYINGAITIKYYDKFIMDYSLWDSVDQLWSYFLNLLEEVLDTGYGITYFPEQPVKIEMKILSNDLLVFSLDEGNIIRELLPMQDFMIALLQGAEEFYTCFMTCFEGIIDFNYELNKIKSIHNQINYTN